MSMLHALVIAVVQGATELFPVSSLGHAVIIPGLLGWNIDQHATSFLPFLVVLYIGTALALLLYFWRDWLGLALSAIGIGPREQRAANWRLIGLIVLATIPAVVAGFLFERPLRHLFGTPAVAAFFLIVNGFILLVGERLRRSIPHIDKSADLAKMRSRDALIVGLWQCLALIPGISRSGVTMVGGLSRGLHYESSAHFSFLIATPIILGAAVLEIPKMLKAGVAPDAVGVAVVSGIVAGVVAFASVWLLMRYFRRHDFQALNPFAYYCGLLGIAALTMLEFSR